MELIHAIYAPRGAGPHPTILALHGWGASALDLLGLAPHLSGGRFLLICPQGTVQTPIGAGAVGYGWFPSSRGGPPDIAAILAARERLRTFLDACMHRYPIEPTQMAVLGFSQGGVMAYSLALAEPECFAGLLALSTWLPMTLFEQMPQRATSADMPILIQHGSRDELVQVDRARQSVEMLRPWRMPLTYREYDMGHEINGRSLTELSAWLDEKVR